MTTEPGRFFSERTELRTFMTTSDRYRLTNASTPSGIPGGKATSAARVVSLGA
jgi:hypothetical protein